MAFPKKIDLIGIALTLMVLTLPSIVANIDCNGKSFHCVNSTHFMICVDLGSGVSSTIDDFVIECPPPTVCQRTNKFECDFPVEPSVTVASIEAPIVTSVSETLETVTIPYELTTSIPIEPYFDTSTTTTLSQDALITHQTIAIVTESTTQLVTDVTHNNEVIIPLNKTIPSVHVQNDLITTTSLPNNIRSNTTETNTDAFVNINVTVPESALNSTVTENILSDNIVQTDLTTASTKPNNISTSALDVFPVETEKANIITHESITKSRLNETIQSTTELSTNEQSLYKASSTNMLSETTTKTTRSSVGIQNNVTTHKPLPMYISANVTGPVNNTAENINAIISGSTINTTFNTTDSSVILDIVSIVLSNNENNITDLVKDPVENITFSTTGVESKLNLRDIVEPTTESILYNVTESIPSTQNDLIKLTPNNLSTNATENVSAVLSTSEINFTLTVSTTPNMDVVQYDSITLNNNNSDYVTDLIPNSTETSDILISDVSVLSLIDAAQTEPTLLSTSNSTINNNTSADIVTESILNEVTNLTSNGTYLSSEALPILINDTTTDTIWNNVSETIKNNEVERDLLPGTYVNTRDDTKINSVLNETTSKFRSKSAQNELTYISTSSTLIPSPGAEAITEVLRKVTEIAPNASVSQNNLDEELNVNKTSTLLLNKVDADSMLYATDTTVLLPESANDYSLNATITSMNVRKNYSTTPLQRINNYTTVLTLDTTENSNVTARKHYSTLNKTIQNYTHTVKTEHTLLLNVSSSTALPDIDTESTWETPIQIANETTPSTYFEQNNLTMTLHENNTLSAVDLILGVKENVLVPGSETKLSDKNENLGQNETISITLPVTDLITEATKSVNVNMLETQRNRTTNGTVTKVDNIENIYPETLNTITLPNNNTDFASGSILGEIARPHLSVDTAQTSYTSNTTLPDQSINSVKEFPVINVTENVIIAKTNLTLNDSSFGSPEVTTNSSNVSLLSNKIVENENIVSNNSQPQPYAHNITVSKTINIEPIHTNNVINLPINEIYQVNSKVSMTSAFNLTTTFVNDNNKTVVEATTVFPEDLNFEANTTDKAIFFTSSSATQEPNYLLDAKSAQNIEASTQNTDIKNDSHIELNFLESVKDVNIPNTVQNTASSLRLESSNIEIVSFSSTNLDTTTSTSERVNQGYDNMEKKDTYTIHKEITDITASEYGMSTFQTEYPTVRVTVVADTLAPDTESSGKAYITDSATVNSIGVTESYRNIFADANSDTNTFMKSLVSAVNIGVETTQEIKPILLFNSSPELISYGGQITTATYVSPKSLPGQDTVKATTTNILFASRALSSLAQENMSSVKYESYTESTVNTVINLQENVLNETAHTIKIADLSTDTLKTSATRKEFIQETKNLESQPNATEVLENALQNRQETIVEKSTLPKMEQNQVLKPNKQKNTLLDILLNTPIHLMMSSQPTVPQTKYAVVYTPTNTLSLDNLTQPIDDFANKKVPINVDSATKLRIELNPKRTQNEGIKETVDIKHGKDNETIFIPTMNVSSSSQPKPKVESLQISNSLQTSKAKAFPADQDNVTLKLDSSDVLTIQPTTEVRRLTVVTKPQEDQNVVTSKQYLADTPPSRPLTESWRATVVTKPYINQDYVTRNQHFAITTGFKSSTEFHSWRETAVTAPQKEQEIVTLKQYSTDPPTSQHSTEAWRIPLVTKPDIGVAITPPPLIKIESLGKLPAMKDTIQSSNKQNEVISVIKLSVTNPNANEKPLIDAKSTTKPFIESWSKVPENEDGITNDSQSKQYLPAPTMEFINIYPVNQKTEPVITKTLATNMDMDIVTIDVVKPNVPLSIQSNSPTGTYVDMSLKLPRTDKGNNSEPEDIESVEQPERNEEQEISEHKESQREKIEEKLEASENNKGELNKIGVVSTQNNRSFGSTVEMTTKKAEDTFYGHYKPITNIDVQPTIIKSSANLEETKVADTRKQIGINVKNRTVSLSKSFVNTHNVSAPMSELAKSSFVCKQNSRGKFPDNNDCRKFYICIGKHEPTEGLCPNNTVFSELRKQCTKNFSHCVRNNQFQCVLEGRFSDYLNDNIYYICVKNNMGTFTRFKLQCQSGYHLNKTSVRCALNTESSQPTPQQSISDISKNSEQSVSSARSEKLVVKSIDKFECKSEGKFPDPNNCRKYYVCSKRNEKLRYRQKCKTCDSDEIFHKDKKKCVDAESYDCS